MKMRKFLVAAMATFVTTIAMAQVGPSFNCRYAKAPDEVLICQDEQLAKLDREMAPAYSGWLNNSWISDKRWFRAEQGAWLKRRRACGYNFDWISKAYSDRLVEVHNMD